MISFSWNAPRASVSKDLQAELCLSSCLPLQRDHAQAHFRGLAAGCCHRCSAAALGATHKIISCELVSAGAAKLLSFWQAHRKTKDGPRVCLTLPRASRLHSRKTVRCSLRPQFSSIHRRASQTHGFRQLRKPACRIALQLRILMGFAFCIDGPREDWHQISRSQEQNGVSWKNRLPVQVVRAGTTAPPRQNGNSSF